MPLSHATTDCEYCQKLINSQPVMDNILCAVLLVSELRHTFHNMFRTTTFIRFLTISKINNRTVTLPYERHNRKKISKILSDYISNHLLQSVQL